MTAPTFLYESTYGRVQSRYLWPVAFLGVIGVIGIPLGIFFNDGWEVGGHPLEPWAATLIIEIVSVGALLIAGAVVMSLQLRRKSPQRVAITGTSLIVPRGLLSTRELHLPFTEIKTTVFDVGFVKQLQIKHGRKKILLTSALFPTNADFDQFVKHLPK